MHEEKVTQSNHYSTVNKQDNSDLIITDVREDDAGIYICQINTEPLRNKVIFYQYPLRLSLKQYCNEYNEKLIDQLENNARKKNALFSVFQS